MDEVRAIRASVTREQLKTKTYTPEYVVLEGKEEKPCTKVMYEILYRQLARAGGKHEPA
jgi:hypothetical protein